jgi:hypothetical protein
MNAFLKDFAGVKLTNWSNHVAQISTFSLVDGSDTFRWNLTKSGLFTVRSIYLHLLDSHPPFKNISKFKVPLKIKIFLWFLQKEVVLTKGNLAWKSWKGSQKCVGCNLNETVQHIYGQSLCENGLEDDISSYRFNSTQVDTTYVRFLAF